MIFENALTRAWGTVAGVCTGTPQVELPTTALVMTTHLGLLSAYSCYTLHGRTWPPACDTDVATRCRRNQVLIACVLYAVRMSQRDDDSAETQRRSASVFIDNPTCLDSDTACEDWARKGECTRNPVFMEATCRQACEFCHTRVDVRA